MTWLAHLALAEPLVPHAVAEVESGSGQLGKNDDPLIADGPAPPADTDLDGMPDAWESAHGLDSTDASDASALAASGYANVELYLAERATELVGK